MYGRVERDMRGRLAPGQDLVVAGTIGLRGAALLARTLDTRLRERFSPEFVERAQALDQGMISGAPDAVSYTHLDVYKRQGGRRTTPSSPTLRKRRT